MSTTMADPADVVMAGTPRLETTMADTVSTGVAGGAVASTAAASTALEHSGAARDLDSGGALAEGAINMAITPFLERPPEIRNLIYKAMFENDAPVTLKAYSHRKMSKWDAIRAIPNRNILFTCKTICQEAIGIMYSCNTWLITFGNVDDWMNYPIVTRVGDWLLALGKRMASLRDIQIDIMSDFNCRRFPLHIDVTALVKRIARLSKAAELGSGQQWSKPSFVVPQISFIPGDYCSTEMEQSSESDYQAASQTLRLLLEAASSNKSSLPSDLCSLLRCWRTVDSVHLSNNGSRVDLVLPTRFGEERSEMSDVIKLKYQKNTTGQWCKLTEPAREVNIDDLLHSYTVAARILDYVLQPENILVYDLDEHAALPGSDLLQTNQRFRNAVFSYYEYTTLDIWVTVSPPERGKQQFARLLDFLNVHFHRQDCIIEFCLDIRLLKGQSLADTRIEAIEFLEATALVCTTNVALYNSPYFGHCITSKSLECVRHRLLEFLICLLDIGPEYALFPWPTIYMNHQCDMVEAHLSLHRDLSITIHNDKISGEEVSDSVIAECVRRLKSREDELNSVTNETTLLGCALKVAQTSYLWTFD
ncbi:hypothetical protein C7974DRAFT_449079 [Boeremia exigua]|uniref:uncharacterized protein n=1 Tax=Boeremia exigua TaxID=749465 RepID=UPI001E8CB446|nr:uncharacterized protein C7974DRAFT_449079 [Boeremia exigua]KAH6639145.1 hypothetical protein C7974DRAFT_449079 [Boeremia exigua]